MIEISSGDLLDFYVGVLENPYNLSTWYCFIGNDGSSLLNSRSDHLYMDVKTISRLANLLGNDCSS